MIYHKFCGEHYTKNTQQTQTKMNVNLSDDPRFLKSEKSFIACYYQHLKYNTSYTDLCKCMTFKSILSDQSYLIYENIYKTKLQPMFGVMLNNY